MGECPVAADAAGSPGARGGCAGAVDGMGTPRSPAGPAPGGTAGWHGCSSLAAGTAAGRAGQRAALAARGRWHAQPGAGGMNAFAAVEQAEVAGAQASESYRRSALLLHGLAQADREWVLGQLTAPQAERLRALLQ